MIKNLFCLFLGLMFFNGAFAQKDTLVYYLSSSGRLVTTKQDADFIVAILSPDSSTHKDLFIVNGYYLTGKKLFTGTSLTKSFPLKFQGTYVNYFANGHKMSIKNFNNGEPIGDEILFYPNGRFYNKKSYVTTMDTTELQYMDCSDSTGKVLAENGNGNWIDYNESFTRILLQGKVSNGLQDSVWTVSPNEYNTFTEVYKNGKLLGDNGGSNKIYTLVETNPEFPGGLEAFYKFLGHNIRYPATAWESKTQGRVVVTFVVERDGRLIDLRVTKGIGHGCDEEALRVISLSSPWIPGTQRGKPVRVMYSVPINFTIANDN